MYVCVRVFAGSGGGGSGGGWECVGGGDVCKGISTGINNLMTMHVA